MVEYLSDRRLPFVAKHGREGKNAEKSYLDTSVGRTTGGQQGVVDRLDSERQLKLNMMNSSSMNLSMDC